MDTTKLVSAAVASSGAIVIAFHSLATILAIVIPPAVVFVSSLIVGFTDYPTTKSVLDVVLRLLNFLSLLVHRNSPGTVKPPLTMSPPPGVVGSTVIPGAAGSAAVKVLMVASLALTGVISCAHMPVPVQQAIDCAQQALQAGIANALQDVATALNGSVSWAQELDSAVVKWGLDAVVCAVTEYANDLTHASVRTDQQEAALVNARAWLTGQNKRAASGAP